MTSTVSCPVCGGSLDGVGPLVRSVECPSCGSWIVVGDSGWVVGGGDRNRLDAPPFLHVGREGRLGNAAVRVAGRVRLGDEDGAWDEWWLEFDGGTDGCWLEEDEGRYLLHQEQQIDVRDAGAARVGGTLAAGGRNWLIVESFDARVLGAEGALPLVVPIGARVRCVDAVAGGEKLSVEIWGDELVASVARPADASGLAW